MTPDQSVGVVLVILGVFVCAVLWVTKRRDDE